MTERNVDAEFDAIVARWHEPDSVFSGDRSPSLDAADEPADTVVRPDPVSAPAEQDEDQPPPVRIDRLGARVHRRTAANPPFPAPPPDPIEQGWRSFELVTPEESFVPPPPATVPKAGADPTFWTITACLTIGPFLLMVLAVTGGLGRGWLVTLGGVLTAVGFILLVLRLPSGDSSSGDDDGARL